MLSRRDMLKYGLATATLSGVSTVRAGADDGGGVGKSPFKTDEFREPLPIPSIKKPLNETSSTTCLSRLSGNDRLVSPREHPFIERPDFQPVFAYEIHAREGYQSFYPTIPPTRIWGYDGTTPGPALEATYGQPIMVRFFNDLPKDHVGFGIPSITPHLHNGHTASQSDGFPGNFFDSGTCWDNHYPNALNGFTETPEINDPSECMNSLWYHDHRQDFTAQNVYAGLAGGYRLFDPLDCGDELNTSGFQLPSGPCDVTLVFGDKVFDAAGQLVYDFFNLDGILGDKMTVNGKIRPYLDVKPRKYRFRLLDGGPSRFYGFALSDGTKLIQIANDGNLLAAPVERSIVTCGVAERHDVVVDFAKYKPGTRLYLLNRAEQTDGRGPTGKLLTPGEPLLEFRVTAFDEADPSRLPGVLRAPRAIDLTKVVKHRTFVFDRSGGGWTVNGNIFNVNKAYATVKVNTREVWTLANGGGGWSHPIHIHMEEFQILSRNGRTPAVWEDRMRKDVVVLGPDDRVEVYFNFRDFTGPYVMHCHNVVHEDHAMMIRFDIVP